MFEATLPPEWVCRRKGGDYGVDLEVEIFTPDGSSTGLMFYVQLKGTDDPTLENKVQIETDRLNYLLSFDAPAMIVRCCMVSEKLFFLWADQAIMQCKKDARSVTLIFEDLWTAVSPVSIGTRLERLRRLKRASPSEEIYLALISEVDSTAHLSALSILDELCGSLHFLRRQFVVPNDRLSLRLTVRAEQLVISLDQHASLEVEVDVGSSTGLRSAMSYGLLAACWKMGITVRATEIARYCLGCEITTGFRELAAYGVSALQMDIEDAVELALLNELHVYQDSYFLHVAKILLEGGRNFSDAMAKKRFYLEAIASQKRSFDVASIHYSLANLLANFGDRWEAVRHFNQARKLRSNYLQQKFFIEELAGSLFHCRRFRMASMLYQVAFEIEATPSSKFRLADANLFAGKYREAIDLFTQLTSEAEPVNAAEARLKLEIANWFLAQPHPPSIVRPLALAENAKHAADRGEALDAFILFLTAAFISDQEDLWASCIWMSTAIEPPEISRCIIICAARSSGGRGYSLFKTRFGKAVSEDRISLLDDVNLEARTLLQGWGQEGVTIRLWEDNQTRVIYQKS